MSRISLAPNASGTGTLTIAAPNTNSDRTLTLPDNSGTVLTSASNLAGVTGVGKVLQVVQVVGGAFSTSSTSYVSTGHAATITPTSATSKVLAIYTATTNIQASNTAITCAIYRGATNVTGDAFALYGAAGGWISSTTTISYLDSPATTSATTYTIYAFEGALAGTVSITAGGTLTLLEIAA